MSTKEQLITLPASELQSLEFSNYRAISEQKVEELSQSIREVGVRVAVTLQKTSSGKYLILDGHHRVEAAKRVMAEYSHISLSMPAIVKNLHEKDAAIQKVVSNFERRESLVDRAAGYALLKASGKSTKQIADAVGKDRSTVENHLRFHDMYQAHKQVLDKHIGQLKESFLYKLAQKHSRGDGSDISAAIAEELAPPPPKSAPKADPEALLAEAGFSKTEIRKICSALRSGGIRL